MSKVYRKDEENEKHASADRTTQEELARNGSV